MSLFKVTPEVAVEGSLAMPAGANPEGLLVAGMAYPSSGLGVPPRARVRADGTFTIRVQEADAHALVVDDLRWASEAWVVLNDGSGEKPADIAIPVEPAAPLTVVVTQGADRVPLAGASVNLLRFANIPFMDANGNKGTRVVRLGAMLRTDRDGEAKAGLIRGKHTVTVFTPTIPGRRPVSREFEITSDKPIIDVFHRD